MNCSLCKQKIEVTICRRGIYHVHYGVLTDVNSKEICLKKDDGRNLWIRRPQYFKDSIKEV